MRPQDNNSLWVQMNKMNDYGNFTALPQICVQYYSRLKTSVVGSCFLLLKSALAQAVFTYS